MSFCVTSTGVRGLRGTGLAMHSGQSAAANRYGSGLVEEERLGLCAVADDGLCNHFLISE